MTILNTRVRYIRDNYIENEVRQTVDMKSDIGY